MKTSLGLLLTAATVSLSACGGGSSPPPAPPEKIAQPPVVIEKPLVENVVIDNSPVRGTLVQSPPPLTQSLTQAGVSAAAGKFGTFGTQLLALAGPPACGVDIHQVEYATVGAAGEPTHASAALMVPTGSAAACSAKHPLMVFGHGTAEIRDIDMGNLHPDAAKSTNSISMAAMFAAQGYIVLLPNYAGHNSSPLPYHPHQIAEQMSKDMIDAVAAARKALPKLKTPVAENGKLFLTGYSEGGYAAMATHRAMQAAGITVTASAPLSGTYANAAHFEAVLRQPNLLNGAGTSRTDDMLGMAMQFTAWQKAYGNLYANPSELYNDAFAPAMETLAPVRLAAYASVSAKLPAFLMSKDMPNVAALSLAEQAWYGTPETSLLKTSYLARLVADAAAIPCPATSSSSPLDCASTHPARKAWFKNDLRTWAPAAPMLLCGAQGDRKVPFFNTQLAAAYFQAQGVAPGMVTTLDVSSPATANDLYGQAKATFISGRKLLVANGQNPDSTENSHGVHVFAGCMVATRDFFAKY